MFLAVVSAGVVIHENLYEGDCEDRRVLGAQSSSWEPQLSCIHTQKSAGWSGLPL